MNPLRHLAVVFGRMKKTMTRRILAHRVMYRNPTLISDPTAIWDYGYGDIDAISIGRNVMIGPFVEILVYKRTKHSSVEGKLVIGDNVTITMGVNIRAAGGEIHIGNFTGIGQHCVLVASSHMIDQPGTYIHTRWDESKVGVHIGNNVWVGASCVIVAGVTIGDNAIIGAGSIVTKSVPANEMWAGVPARLIRAISRETQQLEP